MTPDNGGFATAAYLLTAIIYLVYAASLFSRERRLRARLERADAHTAGRPADRA